MSILTDHPSIILKNCADRFMVKHPSVRVRIVTDADEDDGAMVVVLYFHILELSHYQYRLVHFKLPIDHQGNFYGFEVFGFRDDTSFGIVNSKDAFESALDQIFFHSRTEQIIDEIGLIAGVSGHTLQPQ